MTHPFPHSQIERLNLTSVALQRVIGLTVTHMRTLFGSEQFSHSPQTAAACDLHRV